MKRVRLLYGLNAGFAGRSRSKIGFQAVKPSQLSLSSRRSRTLMYGAGADPEPNRRRQRYRGVGVVAALVRPDHTRTAPETSRHADRTRDSRHVNRTRDQPSTHERDPNRPNHVVRSRDQPTRGPHPSRGGPLG